MKTQQSRPLTPQEEEFSFALPRGSDSPLSGKVRKARRAAEKASLVSANLRRPR